jgi:transcriptional regulator with XRE-family HTH domain
VPQRDELAVLKKMLGADIRSVRNAKGLTLERLAERSGVHRTTIQKIESGERNPRAMTVMSLAKGLGVEPGALMDKGAWDHFSNS